MHLTLRAHDGIKDKTIDVTSADIVVGIASYNNAKTISHVVRAVDAGLGKYFPDEKAIIVDSDGGSTDNTPDVVISTSVEHETFFMSRRLSPVHRIVVPYHGIPGKGSALRTIFQIAASLGAKACCVVDADLRSITPEWIELLIAPVLTRGFDFTAPLYSRHKFDGTITNVIIYPVTTALYGQKIRQPIGGEFGLSARLMDFYLSQSVWDSDTARFGIDIWMTTEAVAGNFKICQSYLGAKIHDPKDPLRDLRDMFVQVVGSLFYLTEKHYQAWKDIKEVREIPTFGLRYSAGAIPIKVDIERMFRNFELGAENLKELWGTFLSRETIGLLMELKNKGQGFYFPNELWVRTIYDYILAFHQKKMPQDHLLKSLLPLYFGKTASFFHEFRDKSDEEVEEAVEDICGEYVGQKDYLLKNWQEGEIHE